MGEIFCDSDASQYAFMLLQSVETGLAQPTEADAGLDFVLARVRLEAESA